MTALQDQPLTRSTTPTRAAQAGDTVGHLQAEQQQSPDRRRPGDREQGGQQEETFTVSVDDWFKA